MRRIERISKRWLRIFLKGKEHLPVMCKEIVEYLDLEKKDWIADCTLGLGSHSYAILKNSQVKVIGIDKDSETLALAKERLSEFEDRVYYFSEDFKNIDKILEILGLEKIDGAVFDLGASLYQFSSFERGFSFLREGPLDMRIDRETTPISAYDLVNNLSEKELDYIFKEYGQEKFHRKIAHSIVEERKGYPIATTLRLAEIVVRACKGKNFRIHPATRVFQALRIVVNQELDSLTFGLNKAISYLSKGARICVVTFHSLEDRIVKETFKISQTKRVLKLITAQPLRPSSWERKINPSCRSAKLRVAERL